MKDTTRFDAPIIMIHGLLGWGEKRPLFGAFPSYFPLEQLRGAWQSGPVIAVDVGIGSSDHDRACEAFAQLFGIQTDYGEAHASKCGHEQFGPDYSEKGMLPRWGSAHPVHLIGHSFGGNTALTLFNLLAEDYWGLGTTGEWVASITTICSPMHGASLPFAMGLVEPCAPGQSPIRPWSFIYFVNLNCATLFYLQLFFPWFANIYGFRMRQWKTQTSISDWLFGRNAYWMSGDNMLSEATPRCCRERLRNGLEHLAKIHLIAVVADSVEPMSPAAAAKTFTRQMVRLAVPSIAAFVISVRCLRTAKKFRFACLHGKQWFLSMLATLFASVVVASATGSNAGERVMNVLRPFLHSFCVRPTMSLTAHFVAGAAASLPKGSGLLVGGGDVLGNDGLIDVSSQNGLDTPLVQSANRRLPGSDGRSTMSSNFVAGMTGKVPRALAMTRTYSEVVVSDAKAAQPIQCLEKGKWRIIRVPNGDHSLGTIMSVQSSAMYLAVFSILERIKQ